MHVCKTLRKSLQEFGTRSGSTMNKEIKQAVQKVLQWFEHGHVGANAYMNKYVTGTYRVLSMVTKKM